MEESQISGKNYSGRIIARNTLYNLIGYGAPLLIAIIVFPYLIRGLGEERFGILNLIWIFIGYFSFFDFGIGKTLTKITAEKLGLNQIKEIPPIFWTSLLLIISISLFATIIFFLFTPFLVYDLLNITSGLQEETLITFYILAFSIPLVSTTAGLRGMLEAYQKFKVVNILRIFLGTSTFLGPLICLFFSNNLFWIALVLSLIRIIVLLLYLKQCFQTNIGIKNEIGFNRELVKPILNLSGWITVSNFTGPLIIYLDRFLIGTLLSAAAITYYATPYEIVTKLLLIPGAIITVLFPAFSATYNYNPFFSKKLFSRGVKYVFISIFPIVLAIVFFAHEGLNLWLDNDFANISTFILKTLSVGVLFNSLAYLPFNLLQGIGKPDIVGKLQLIELPPYIIIIGLVAVKYGIDGVAVIWTLRILIDAGVLFYLAKINLNYKFNSTVVLLMVFSVITLLIPYWIDNVFEKAFLLFFILSFFTYYVWNYLLFTDEKDYLKEILFSLKKGLRI